MRRFLKSAAALAAGLALAAGTLAGSALPAEAADGCPVPKSYPTLKASSSGSRVQTAECLLAKAGYGASVDGTFAAEDTAATVAFQTSVGLRATGVIARPEWTALIARGTRPTLHVGDKGAAVKRLQRALRAAGYVKWTGGGRFGPNTRAAVKAVQRAQGWRATGTATAGVWKVLQSGAAAVAKQSATAKASASKSKSTKRGLRALAFARKQLGDRYRYGATGPNAWDCSGLTRGSWKAAGKKLPRTSQAQWHVGKRVSKSHLRKGDLVFFYSGRTHVAIYAGNGRVIHAPRPGSKVSYIKMKYMPYAGSRRP